MTQYSVLVYRTRNLGDMMQTLALTRLVGEAAGVYRHRLDEAPADRLFVVNGMLDKDPAPRREGAPCLFAGVSGPHFRKKEYLRWMGASPFPIGARDQRTLELVTASGHRAVLAGCATLTLPRYDGARSGAYAVDCEGPGVALTHAITRETTVEQQWSLAGEYLDRYRTAAEVRTSRLHVALPCLAFGTPVWIKNPARGAWRPERYSLIEELGLRYETLVTADVSPLAQRYVRFLREHLDLAKKPGEPILPDLPSDPGVPRRWFGR